MVKRIIIFAGKAAGAAKSVLFADPKLLYKEQRHLVNKPFFFVGNNGKGILLVHGWTSTPYEVRRLGEFLNEAGYTVMGIQLTGHGTVPKDLEGVKWQQWIDDVQAGYDQLKKTCDRVYIGGTSIGGSLSLLFAAQCEDISGIIAMATPYKMKFERIALLVATAMVHMKKKYRKKFYPPTFGVSTTITRLISYQSYPVKSVIEAFECVKAARQQLGKVTQPCFVLQSSHDHIVAHHSLEKIYNQVSSKIKRKEYIEKAYHTFISDIKNEHVFKDILNFLNEN